MSKVVVDISVSLDGFVAGPDRTLEEPLGVGGEKLHAWVISTRGWRETHGLDGGEEGTNSDLIKETVDRAGATIMGRGMFSGGSGPWSEDPNADAWWGDEPPFHHPVFVLTHHEREPQQKDGGTTFTFVTGGIDAALEQARGAAGDKDIQISGGGNTIQQFLNAGFVDEINLHIAPVLLGGGVRLFDGPKDVPVEFKIERVISSDGATHVRYVM
jgi:dihydrofolate reductase